MPQLTLSADERRAFDWIGHRYATGHDVYSVLLDHMPEGSEWDDEGTITFVLPNHAVQMIAGLSEEEDHLWPCFASELTCKMNHLIQGVV